MNNGTGIEEAVIDDILHSENRVYNSEGNEDNNGVGLKNVLARMRLFYGVDNVMNIYSDGKNMGTKIVLHIPCKCGQQGDLGRLVCIK